LEKRLQNIIAENVLTLYVCTIYGLFTWIMAGVFVHHLWWQLILLAATNYLMIEMSKDIIFLRIRSWMVTSTFMMLTAGCGFNYGSMEAGIVGLCTAITLFMLFLTYQNPEDVNHTYYAYLSLGIASLFYVQALYFVPLIWLLTLYTIQSLGIRTWLSSLLGLITPYWFALPLFLYWQDFDTIKEHFSPLVYFPDSEISLMPIQIILFIVVAALALIGAINFWRQSYEERIRTRQIYDFLQWLGVAVSIFILLQPQHFDTLIRVVLICASPFIAHFFTFTSTKVTYYLFIITVLLLLALSIVSTNETLLNFTNQAIYDGLGD
jgi:hypothetical protein